MPAVYVAVLGITLSCGGDGATDPPDDRPHTIVLSNTNLTFNSIQAGANPPSQQINITNGEVGTLSGLNIGTISYGPGATGWLQAPSLGSGTAPATLTIQPVTGNLASGTYIATVPVQSGAASNTPQNLSVSFTLSAAASLTACRLAATNAFIGLGFPRVVDRLPSVGTVRIAVMCASRSSSSTSQMLLRRVHRRVLSHFCRQRVRAITQAYRTENRIWFFSQVMCGAE
jgi:hypothetical protein